MILNVAQAIIQRLLDTPSHRAEDIVHVYDALLQVQGFRLGVGVGVGVCGSVGWIRD